MDTDIPVCILDLEKAFKHAILGIRRGYVFAGIANNSTFSDDLISIHPHNGMRLDMGKVTDESLKAIQNEYQQWVLKNCVREVIELFNISVDKIFECIYYVENYPHNFDENKFKQDCKVFSRKNFPDKLKLIYKFLDCDHEKFKDFFIGVQSLRNAITHNIGVVKHEKGINVWLPIFVPYIEMENGERHYFTLGETLSRDSIVNQRTSEPRTLSVEYRNTTKTFNKGEFITFTPEEISQIFFAFEESIKNLKLAMVQTLKKKGLNVYKINNEENNERTN